MVEARRIGEKLSLQRIPPRGLLLAAGLCLAPAAMAEMSFVTVENRSGQVARIAIPGGKSVRVQPESEKSRIEIEVTHANGVEAKAWWDANPRQLCVIFIRYEGHLVVAGKKSIRCLGH